jgi:hypothetical protein
MQFLQKPLLAAALEAKEDSHPCISAQNMPTKRISAGVHLEGLNQPRDSCYDEESDTSIVSCQLFDAPESMVYKPLLAARLEPPPTDGCTTQFYQCG